MIVCPQIRLNLPILRGKNDELNKNDRHHQT